MKAVLTVLAGALVVVGCASPSASGDLRESDLRSSGHKYVDDSIYMDLSTVQRHLYIHREACEVEVDFRKDPEQVHFATIFYGPAGAETLKDQVMLDLTSYVTGKLAIKGYSYYVANKQLVGDLVKVLQTPTTCPEGIQVNLNPNPYVNMTPRTSTDTKKE